MGERRIVRQGRKNGLLRLDGKEKIGYVVILYHSVLKFLWFASAKSEEGTERRTLVGFALRKISSRQYTLHLCLQSVHKGRLDRSIIVHRLSLHIDGGLYIRQFGGDRNRGSVR